MTEKPKPKRKRAALKGDAAAAKGGTAAAEASAEPRPVHAEPITDDDLHLFNEGSHYHLYRKLGCHLTTLGGHAGATFAVWAPNARAVSVFGDFNGRDPRTHRLATRGASGIWEGFIRVVHGNRSLSYRELADRLVPSATSPRPAATAPRRT